MNRRLVLCLCSLLFVAAPALAADEPVEIVSAEFGIFDASTPGELAFEPTRLVPHAEGQRYGWIVEVRTKKRSLTVREEYLLPTAATEQAAAAAKAGKPADAAGRIDTPLPRRNQVSQRQLVPMGGRIYGEWAIGPGEPAGKRHLQVIVEGQVAADFEYEVK